MVLISDIGMPERTATRSFARCAPRRRAPRIPAIALTAYARDEDRRRALERGLSGHLAKPVEPDALVRLVGDLARAAKPG